MNLKSLQHRWTLTEFGQGAHQQRTIDLPNRALIIGRASDADISISAAGVSKKHARITINDDTLMIEDLGSTNGTFLNGNRIERSVATVGDLVQFANALYKVDRLGRSVSDGTVEESVLPWAQTLLLFDRLINERQVAPAFQAIVSLTDSKSVAQELLARSDLEGLTQPALMFGAAERLGQQATLSELMREEGMRIVGLTMPTPVDTFLNTHPAEVGTDRLIDSLVRLREQFPALPMTIEIHEAAVTDTDNMSTLHHVLKSLEMRLSYDDFGAGQGRLLELTEVPPDVLKFDMQLIRDINLASASRQDLLRALIRIAKDSGSVTLAEGIETREEHETCQQLGFDLGQGFLFGRPVPLTQMQ